MEWYYRQRMRLLEALDHWVHRHEGEYPDYRMSRIDRWLCEAYEYEVTGGEEGRRLFHLK